MKALHLFFAFVIGFCFFSIASTQTKPVAIRFGSYEKLPYENTGIFTERTNNFIKQIKKETSTNKAVIIFYNQRKGIFPLNGGKEFNDYALQMIVNDYTKIPTNRVISIDGGFREYPSVEFWIVPPDAELPKPTPTFDKTETAVCPEINVAGDGFQRDRKLPLKFSVAIKGEEPDSKLGFEWNVSAGKIIAGQGTNQIQINLSETSAKQITASVQVKGLTPECDNHSFSTTEVGSFPYKIDEFGFVYYSDLSARFDGFISYIYSEPSMTGYIIIYGPREGNSKAVLKTIYNIKKLMAFRQYDASRVKIVEGGFREEGMIEFYLIPQGAEVPKPTPTVDEKFVVFTDKIKQNKSRKRK